jgi:hypothetical protein
VAGHSGSEEVRERALMTRPPGLFLRYASLFDVIVTKVRSRASLGAAVKRDDRQEQA